MFDTHTHTRIREVTKCGTLVLTLAILAWAAPLPVSAARVPSAWQQVCIDNWNDSHARGYCSAGVVERVGGSTGNDEGNCLVEQVDCTITATVGSGEDAESTTWWEYHESNLSPEATKRLDLCFHALDTGKYRLAVKDCSYPDIDSDTAIQDGLPALEPKPAPGP